MLPEPHFQVEPRPENPNRRLAPISEPVSTPRPISREPSLLKRVSGGLALLAGAGALWGLAKKEPVAEEHLKTVPSDETSEVVAAEPLAPEPPVRFPTSFDSGEPEGEPLAPALDGGVAPDANEMDEEGEYAFDPEDGSMSTEDKEKAKAAFKNFKMAKKLLKEQLAGWEIAKEDFSGFKGQIFVRPAPNHRVIAIEITDQGLQVKPASELDQEIEVFEPAGLEAALRDKEKYEAALQYAMVNADDNDPFKETHRMQRLWEEATRLGLNPDYALYQTELDTARSEDNQHNDPLPSETPTVIAMAGDDEPALTPEPSAEPTMSEPSIPGMEGSGSEAGISEAVSSEPNVDVMDGETPPASEEGAGDTGSTEEPWDDEQSGQEQAP